MANNVTIDKSISTKNSAICEDQGIKAILTRNGKGKHLQRRTQSAIQTGRGGYRPSLRFAPFVGLLCCCLAVAAPAEAGKLKAFETAARRSSSIPSSSAISSDSFFGSLLEVIFSELIYFTAHYLFVYGPTATAERVDPDLWTATTEFSETDLRRIGDPDLPIFRADIQYQYIDEQVQGLDGRMEAGYGPLGVQARHTTYWERNPSDTLHFTSLHGLLRLSTTPYFECDLGLGVALMAGEEKNSGFSLTLPMTWYPTDNLAIRFAPTTFWIADYPVSDYECSLAYGQSFVSWRLGYRWLRTGDERIHGPFAGVSFHY